MATLRSIIKALSPTVLAEIVDAKNVLASVSNQPWLDALSSRKRAAVDLSQLAILPPEFKKARSFVIDVGANQGQWIGSLTEILPIPEVWIFEPNPEAMRICRKRMGDGPGVKYFDTALGDAAGQVTLHITASSEFASVLQARERVLETHYGKDASRLVTEKRVEVCCLDSLVPESKSVDLLKIDVQGFERAVLSGARRVLSNTRAVLIEANLQSHYVGDDNFAAIWTMLSDRGFSFWSLSPPHSGCGGQALWADTIFVK
jgi:FkbM family methyltransferase